MQATNMIRIALAGNPNCGKTTLFNELTRSNGYVGNWPGVTVEKKEAPWHVDRTVIITDLPGIYSLSPYSPEEIVSRNYLVQDRPTAVVNLVDVTNLERNLYLTTQVLECGLPVVVGLNMCDLLEKNGIVLDSKALSEALGCTCVEVSALKKMNIDELMKAACDSGRASAVPAPRRIFDDHIEDALGKIAHLIDGKCDSSLVRWFAIKIFERDTEALALLDLTSSERDKAETYIQAVEEELDDDAESIITTARYRWIAKVIDKSVVKAEKVKTTTERIDRVVTNRFLGLPIFVAVMVAVYFLAIATVGTAATKWMGDGVFGQGWHFLGIGAHEYEQASDEYTAHDYEGQIAGYVAAASKAGIDVERVKAALDKEDRTEEDTAVIEDFKRTTQLFNVYAPEVPVKDADGNFLDTDDEIVSSQGSGDEIVPVLKANQRLKTVAVDHEAFVAALEATKPQPSQYGLWVPGLSALAETALESAHAAPLVKNLVVDGVIAGVGSILGFIPQMFVLFVMLCFLEDCGYMSRIAFVMDRAFRRFGLSGKSFIPMLISSGCGVPGVMATKTIEREADRRMTIMTTTMVPCSAKLPIISLLMGALIGRTSAWWIAPLFYFLGVASIIVSAIMLKKFRAFSGESAPFVMELPQYHFPSCKSWALHVWERIHSFVAKAGSIIFIATVGVWFLSNFGFATWEGGTGAFGFLSDMPAAPEQHMDYSLLAGFGSILSWLFIPLGFGTWQAVAVTVTGLLAKENLVATLAVLFGLDKVSETTTVLWSSFGSMFTVNGMLHVGSMFAFVAFNLLCAPCFAAMGTIRRQMNSGKWTAAAIGYECAFGWVVGLIINQVYEFVAFRSITIWTAVAAICAGAMLFQIFRPIPHRKNKKSDEVPVPSAHGE